MTEAEIRRMFEFLSRLTGGLAGALGESCEIVLHDFRQPEQSIIAIANGHITGRRVGDTLDALGLEALRKPPRQDLINYRTETRDGKALRSSSILLRDEGGQAYGALCVNLDVTGLLKAQHFLEAITTPERTGIAEGFEHSVDEVLALLVQDAIRATGKDVAAMNREDKITVIAHLEEKGAFLIRYSVDRVAELLNISKYTIYNYLEEIRTRQSEAESVES